MLFQSVRALRQRSKVKSIDCVKIPSCPRVVAVVTKGQFAPLRNHSLAPEKI